MKIPCLVLIGTALYISATTSLAQVTTQVTSTHIAQNESLQVRYETTSAAGWPDLSPLERDFYIQSRNISRSQQTINGHTSHRSTLSLRLLPKRSGELNLPAIDFGPESSDAIKIQVSSLNQDPKPVYPTLAPPASINGLPAPAPSPWIQAPAWPAPGEELPVAVTAPEPAPAQQVDRPIPTGSQSGYWPWLTGVALLGWFLTGLWIWRNKSRSPSHPAIQPEIQTPAPREDPADALPAIALAYRQNDAYAAKKALLHWASLRWPDDPPGNLGRLAARCPGNVQTQIMRLEEALYSKEPQGWNERAIWEQLPKQDKDTKSAAV